MAIVAANGQDPNQQMNQPNMGGSGTITGSGVPGGGGSSSAYQAPAASPSGTPNIQQYLAANQGAGQRLAGGISQNVQGQANQLGQQVNQQSNQLNQQYQPLNQQVQGGQQAANVAFQNPQALLAAYQNSQSNSTTAPNQTDLSNYNAFQGNIAGTNQYNQQQQGIQNYNQAGQQANNNLQTQLGTLQQTANMGANQMGQQQLLQQTIGTPTYTPGESALDALFLQGQGNQLQKNLQGIYNTQQQGVSGLQTDYQNKLAGLQQLSGQNAAYANNLFQNGAPSQQGAGIKQITSDVNNAVTAAQAQEAQIPQLQQALNSNSITPAQAQAMGLAPGTSTYGAQNLGQYLNPAATPTASNVANADEASRYLALQQLSGGANTLFGGNTTGFGTFNPYTLQPGFQTAINSAQQQLQAPVTQDVNAILGPKGAQGYSGFSGAPGNPWGTFYNQLAGATTPQQQMAAVNQYIGTQGGHPTQDVISLQNALQNYINGQNIQLGKANPNTNPLSQTKTPGSSLALPSSGES